MKKTDRFNVPAQVMARQLEQETVILDLASGSYFGLDNAGARIWELASDGQDLATVCQALVDEFDAAPEQIEADVFRLIGELLSRQLLQTKE